MVAAAVRHLLPGAGRRAYSDEEFSVINDVLDAAQDWADGKLPLAEFWKTGTLQPRRWSTKELVCHGADQTGYSRFVALNYATQVKDRRLAALIAALEAAHNNHWIHPRKAGT